MSKTVAPRGCFCLMVVLLTLLPVCWAETAGYEAEGETSAQENAPEYLSEFGYFSNPRLHIPAEGVFPYEVNTPHFADYATLKRFIKVPEGSSIQLKEDFSMEYPVGTILILAVSYPADLQVDASAEHLIETRVLINRGHTWDAFQYVWDEAMQDARLQKAGGSKKVSWLNHDGAQRAHTYYLPNQNQCNQCHVQEGAFVPLGPASAKNLNREIETEQGTDNQLAYWARLGLLNAPPEKLNEVPVFPLWDDPASATLEERARAYLDMNCSACHRPGGIAFTSGLDLRFEQREPVHFGVYKTPVAAGRGVGGGRFDIVPGKPDESVLLIRMISTDPGVRMPIVGRGITHEEGVALVREWITSISYPELEESQHYLDQQRERVESAQEVVLSTAANY